MYIPKQFAESSAEELHRIVRDHPFGMIVTNAASGLDACHLPLILNTKNTESKTLIGHVARANPIWTEVRDGDRVLVVFRGAHGYISPGWYPGKEEDHRRVPTWNYEVVHVHGTIHIHHAADFLLDVVALLTSQHEAGQVHPWALSDAPPAFLEGLLQHIVGLEIRITHIEGKRKLNQHHQEKDREGAIVNLEYHGNHALAQAMRQAAPRGVKEK